MVEKEKHQDENGKVNVRFSNCMLKQIKTISNYGDDVINVYITFRFRTRNEIPDFGIGNCLFGALKYKNVQLANHTINTLDMVYVMILLESFLLAIIIKQYL